jgi:hypothetical protein
VDNREKASLIWLGIALAAGLTNRDFRGSVGEFVKAFMSLKVVGPLLAFAGWTVVLVTLAHAVGLWEADVRTDTVVWFVTVGLAFFFSLDKVTESGFFRTATRRAVAVTVFIEGFVNLEVFGLAVELVLVPILVLLGLMLVVAESDDEYAPVRRLLNGLLTIIGACALVYVAVRLATDFDAGHASRALSLPVWLTIGSLPFIYMFGLVAEYEQAFLRIDFRTDDRAQRRRAKWALVRAANVRASEVAGFAGHWIGDLASADDARAVARRWRETWRAERHTQRMSDAGEYMRVRLTEEDPTLAEIHADTLRRSWDLLDSEQRATLKAEGIGLTPSAAVADEVRALPD